MHTKKIIVTGTRGSGKSTVVHDLYTSDNRFRQVKSVTTRAQRQDDIPGTYDYVSDDEFQTLHDRGNLFIEAVYSQARYGVRVQDISDVESVGKVAILVLTPDSASKLGGIQETEINGVRAALPSDYLSFFLDAPDDGLNQRVMARSGVPSRDLLEQRQADRKFGAKFTYVLQNLDKNLTRDLIVALWEYNTASGVLPARIILLMISCGILLEHADCTRVSGASYDLSLGDQYFYGGRVKRLSDVDPILLIEPYDYAIVTTQEEVKLPRDVSARFDLSVSLFCQGVILSNGPQIDPGFHGTLFCLLFNTSSSPVLLKRGQHYCSLEFHKLVEPTYAYTGSYLGRDLLHYIPSNAARGAINELKKELEGVRKDSQSVQNLSYSFFALIVALIAVLVVFR